MTRVLKAACGDVWQRWLETLPLTYPEPAARDDLRPLIIDSFAGGGGASTGIELALGRSPDYAINHDEFALQMHEANHPDTKHLVTSVYAVDPRDLRRPGQRVGLAWFSPDCKHHSKAKGGKPLEKNIRDLAWVVAHFAELIQPDVIILENVEEFQDWGSLTQKRDAHGRPVFTKTGQPHMTPDPDLKGRTFNEWVQKHRKIGYKVSWRELRACDYGAPTIRKRLFVIMRRDGKPIIWPEPTHGDPNSADVQSGRLKPWRTAASIIDWSLPCPSIFLTKEQAAEWHKATGQRLVRPLADNTLRRVARGVQRYVIDAKEPFFVTYGQHGGRSRSADDPLHTITASLKDQNQIVVPTLVQTGYGERPGQKPRCLDIHKPLGTVVAGGTKHALVAAFLAQHNAGPRMETNAGRPANVPLSTLTTRGTQQQVVAASMINMRGTSDAQLKGRPITDPVPTVSAGGGHAGLVAAFLTKYYGQGEGQPCGESLHTLTTRDRFGVVTVQVKGQTYAITDIGMRMLTPREQFRAQGFPDSYVIDRGADGRTMPKTQQTQKCGNSVSPQVARALVAANCPDLVERGT